MLRPNATCPDCGRPAHRVDRSEPTRRIVETYCRACGVITDVSIEPPPSPAPEPTPAPAPAPKPKRKPKP